MFVDLRKKLTELMRERKISLRGVQLPDVSLDPETVKVIMISEVPPVNPEDWFYSKTDKPDYMKTTLSLFHDAGVPVAGMEDLLRLGIYITTAVKTPKTGYTVDEELLHTHLPVLRYELDLFPNLKAIMLMGDVAKKALNKIAKQETGKNVVPSGPTYKLRKSELFFRSIRVFPSYIMTGGNLLIEKSKSAMITEDIRTMIKLL
jgi:uracil-DNA glycosylase